MKGLKLISGVILIFVIFLLIPRGHCTDSVNDTVFLEPVEMTNFYNVQASEGDTVK
ncbi:MAG: hypothetical protein ACFE91_11915 [Promethearchaeota archaeon]